MFNLNDQFLAYIHRITCSTVMFKFNEYANTAKVGISWKGWKRTLGDIELEEYLSVKRSSGRTISTGTGV